MCVYGCVCDRERERVCVGVCWCERERERERVRGRERGKKIENFHVLRLQVSSFDLIGCHSQRWRGEDVGQPRQAGNTAVSSNYI